MSKLPIKGYKYLSEFECIGPNCSDSCCIAGWSIKIDDKTLDLYKQKAPELLDTVNKQNMSAVLDKNGVCICYSEDKLCSIHKKYGEEYLSDTCGIYPRNFHRLNNYFLSYGTFSCPEIVRNVLYKTKNPFSISNYRHSRFHDEYISKFRPKDDMKRDLEESMVEAGMKRTHEFIISNNLNPEEMLTSCVNMAFSLNYIKMTDTLEAFDFYIKTIHDRPLIPFEENYQSLFSILFVVFFELNSVSSVLKDLISRIEKELKFKAKTPGRNIEINFSADSVKMYKEKQKIWNKYQDNDEMNNRLKNIISHYLLVHQFPFCPSYISPTKAMLLIVTKYVLSKFLMISLIDKQGNIAEDDVVNIVESIGRGLDHKNTIETVLTNLEDMKLSSEAKLFGIIQAVASVDIKSKFGKMVANKELVKTE